MAPIIEPAVRLISVPFANLVYALVLAISTFAAWLSCIYAKGKKETPAGGRMQTGLLFLFLAQLGLLFATWLAWVGVINAHSFLPTIDRTIGLFSLILMIWLWAIPEPDRIWDSLVALLEIIILLVGITSFVLWLRLAPASIFNTSVLGAYAFFSGLVFILSGIALLLVRRPVNWGYGLVILVVLVVGYLAQIIIGQPASDYTWYIHLSEMVAFVFLLMLPKRLVNLEASTEETPKEIPGGRATTDVDGKLIQSITELVIEPSPQKYYERLTELVARLMNAEACFLMIPPKSGEQVIIPVGFNTGQGKPIEGFTTDGRKMPALLESLKKGTSARFSGSAGFEIHPLSEALGMRHTGHLMMTTFRPIGTSALMGIGVLSKQPASEWSEADVVRLKEVTDTLLVDAARMQAAGKAGNQGELMEKLMRAEAYTDQVRLEYAQLKARYDGVASQLSMSASQAENEKALQESIERLENRNRELENLLAKGKPSMEEVEQLRQELRAALVDLARIPSTLSRSDQKMLETQLSVVKSLDKMQPIELVTSIAQEFRQPLSSIVGYTDLLLGESVGLLGAAQRKFLERVKASTERLAILLNELVEVVTIDGGKVDQTRVSVELEPIIREAVMNIDAQLSEKNITFLLNMPETLPPIQGNKDAVLQILSNLLENACLATSSEGVIQLDVQTERREGEQNFILLSVTDQGGGIDQADISRVFMRRYKMENPLIKGVGDAGVGLSIVKSLVELLKGRVWVDSQSGGSTFSVLLPLLESQSSQTTPISSEAT